MGAVAQSAEAAWTRHDRRIDVMNAVASQNPNQALWEKGDFTRIAATMRESGEALVASL